MKEKMTIGSLAAASGVNLETIRFYERKGLLKQPQKIGAFRYYPEAYITRVKFIKRAQELGFTLAEANELLNLKIKNQSKCVDVLTKTNQKIEEIDKKMADLKRMKKALVKLATCCATKDQSLSDCTILENY